MGFALMIRQHFKSTQLALWEGSYPNGLHIAFPVSLRRRQEFLDSILSGAVLGALSTIT